ncbi:MAG: hypothetical protein ABI472_19285 [Ginsengibacter sp.]
MKLVTCCILLLLFTGFTACENHMDINDIAEGTPTRADTVLPHKFSPHAKYDSLKEKDLPRAFKR